MKDDNRSARRQAARRAEIIQIVGAVIAGVGALLMAIGTTSVALFIFYFVIFAAGAGVIAYGRKLYTDTLKG
ncbi:MULTISPECIES: hypothetical protein [unclassified Leifsonia]|uniref:hypothetical protein n=1 Tax=unclassified Leifsonia TaxID=2663824 RepID=UPI0008A805B1|nr:MULTISPECIES: hypothetical protein [unclassified Leifsonia]SEI09988.1 hypothetical protein SAMN04515694_11540 [Leifsonia sp. CL154]SFL86923.1 hypothetical protein SAMN04515692_11568 [Leifsonia sp. CL147]